MLSERGENRILYGMLNIHIRYEEMNRSIEASIFEKIEHLILLMILIIQKQTFVHTFCGQKN